MSSDRPIIIRRKRVVHAHHGGSWKIALADFMTALMALFLVLWLLSSSGTSELEGIAEYFSTPLLVAIAGGDKPTASTKPIPGGGTDPTHMEGEVARIDRLIQTRPAEIQRTFIDLQRRIQEVLLRPELQEMRDHLRMYLVPEGLLVQLVDNERRAMFKSGSDVVEPYMSLLLRSLAPLLNEMPNLVSISGHTDSHPYRGLAQSYSNWELSSDRANASRRELMAGGLATGKLLRVDGMADKVPLHDVSPDDPRNRRIELMVLNEATSALILRRELRPGPERLSDSAAASAPDSAP